MPPWKHGGGWSQDLTTAHLLCCRFRAYACPAPASHVQLGHRVLIPNPLSTRRTRNRSSWRARIYRSSPIPLLAAGHNFGIDGSFLQGQFEVDFVVAARHRGRRRQLLTQWNILMQRNGVQRFKSTASVKYSERPSAFIRSSYLPEYSIAPK